MACMITTTIYNEKNVLHLSFVDNVGLMHFIELENRLPSVFRCLRSDFTLLVDLSGVEKIDSACVNQIAKLLERIVEAGVGKVVRVVHHSSKDIGFSILEAFHFPARLPVLVYADHEEAEKYLGIESLVSRGKVNAEYFGFCPIQKTTLVI